MKLSIEDFEYIAYKNKIWTAEKTMPKSMIVIEYCGAGDGFFGGNADDRALGQDGLILNKQTAYTKSAASFKTIEEAHEAVKAILLHTTHS